MLGMPVSGVMLGRAEALAGGLLLGALEALRVPLPFPFTAKFGEPPLMYLVAAVVLGGKVTSFWLLTKLGDL